MRALAIAAVATVIAATICPARSQDIPDLNVEPVCRGIAQQAASPAEKGDVDLAYSQCLNSEQAMRHKLVNEWSTFAPAQRSNCIDAELAGMASYTDLVSCLEMARDAANMNLQ